MQDFPEDGAFRTYDSLAGIYRTFLEALPWSDHTRPDRVLNVEAHRPDGSTTSDPGPKGPSLLSRRSLTCAGYGARGNTDPATGCHEDSTAGPSLWRSVCADCAQR